MSLHIHDDLEQGSDDWLDARRGIVTASVVGQLITPSTVKPASNDRSRALVHQLVAERVSGWVEPTYTSPDMWRGIESEPIARDLYSEKYAPVTECGFMVRTEGDWTLGYSPDGLVGEDGLIEVKAPRPKTHVSTVLADQVPAYHAAQIQAGLLVSGRQWCDYISFCGGLPMWTKRVRPDERWQEAIVTACQQFEASATGMLTRWDEQTCDLPPTERLPQDMEMVI